MTSQSTPLFTIVIPSYNRGYILWRAIQSVLAQTERQFEIVVVDDGSTDCTQRMLEAFRDDPVRTIRLSDGPHDRTAGYTKPIATAMMSLGATRR